MIKVFSKLLAYYVQTYTVIFTITFALYLKYLHAELWLVFCTSICSSYCILFVFCVYNFSNYPNLLLTLFFCCLASTGISFRKCKCGLFGSLHLSCQTSQAILHLSHAERDEDFNVYNHCSVDRHKPVNKHSYRFISRALESHTLCSKQSVVLCRSKHIICTLWLKKPLEPSRMENNISPWLATAAKWMLRWKTKSPPGVWRLTADMRISDFQDSSN